MHGLDLMAYNLTGRSSPRHLVTGNSIQDHNPDDVDVTTRHALVLGGVVIFLIICFLAYLLCRKSPPPQQRSYITQHHQHNFGQQGDRRQGEEDLPPSYNQLEHTDLLLKTPFSGPPPSYDEVSKDAMT